jgi:hypothetical protein
MMTRLCNDIDIEPLSEASSATCGAKDDRHRPLGHYHVGYSGMIYHLITRKYHGILIGYPPMAKGYCKIPQIGYPEISMECLRILQIGYSGIPMECHRKSRDCTLIVMRCCKIPRIE